MGLEQVQPHTDRVLGGTNRPPLYKTFAFLLLPSCSCAKLPAALNLSTLPRGRPCPVAVVSFLFPCHDPVTNGAPVGRQPGVCRGAPGWRGPPRPPSAPRAVWAAASASFALLPCDDCVAGWVATRGMRLLIASLLACWTGRAVNAVPARSVGDVRCYPPVFFAYAGVHRLCGTWLVCGGRALTGCATF